MRVEPKMPHSQGESNRFRPLPDPGGSYASSAPPSGPVCLRAAPSYATPVPDSLPASMILSMSATAPAIPRISSCIICCRSSITR